MAQEIEICYNCKGRGHGDGDMMFFVCPRCNGSGVLESAQQSVHLTALRRGLAFVTSLLVVLILVVIYYGGGR